MSEEIQPVAPAEMSAEDIRLRERRSFDAFNEAQAARRQTSRDANAGRDAEESKRWTKREQDGDVTDGTDENDSLGG